MRLPEGSSQPVSPYYPLSIDTNNYSLYKQPSAINSLVLNAKRQYDNGKTFSPKVLLGVVLTRIKNFTPTFIEEDYSKLLQKQIEILISSIN